MLKGLVAWWGRNPVAGNLLMLFCVLAGFSPSTGWRRNSGRPDAATACSSKRSGRARARKTWKARSSSASRKRPPTSTASTGCARVRGEGFGWVRLAADPGADVDCDDARSALARRSRSAACRKAWSRSNVSREVGRNWSIIIGVHGDVDERDAARHGRASARPALAAARRRQHDRVSACARPEVSIEVSEASLQAWGLTFDEVARAVRAQFDQYRRRRCAHARRQFPAAGAQPRRHRARFREHHRPPDRRRRRGAPRRCRHRHRRLPGHQPLFAHERRTVGARLAADRRPLQHLGNRQGGPGSADRSARRTAGRRCRSPRSTTRPKTTTPCSDPLPERRRRASSSSSCCCC